MIDKAYLLLPLFAAVLYTIGAMVLKAAERRGVGPYRITVLANFVSVLGFGLFYPWDEFPRLPAVWWPVLLLAVTIVVGQLTTILAFTRGDVSVATPALGTKVVAVAALASVFATKPVRVETWAAAFVVVAGLWLLLGKPKTGDRRRAAIAIAFALLASLAFGSCDVLIQIWSPKLDFGVLLPIAMLGAWLLSLPLLLIGRPANPGPPDSAWRPLLLGTGLLTAQSLLIAWTIGRFGDAAGVNIVYASRGVWTVLLVQLLPIWFGHVERFNTPGVFSRRLAGSALMMVGVFLAFA